MPPLTPTPEGDYRSHSPTGLGEPYVSDRFASEKVGATVELAGFWPRVAMQISDFIARREVAARDVIVLLPFAQHVGLARAAWATLPQPGWMPRFETTQTLARSLCPTAPPAPGELSFDRVADSLHAQKLLRAHLPASWVNDRRQFDLVVTRLVDTAHALARVWLALAPSERGPWMSQARAVLAAPAVGTPAPPGAVERALARLALEWAETAQNTAADALHALVPASWIAVAAGAIDPLVRSLLASSRVPSLWLDADGAIEEAVAGPAAGRAVWAACSDLEDEAQRAAVQVLVHVSRREVPVALIALDRVLLRRVRALLERQGVALADETGWRLSTTRAGASVVGLLRAAQANASTDDVLDWLASAAASVPGRAALDACWRRQRVATVLHALPEAMTPDALQAWQQWLHIAEPLQAPGLARRGRLGPWLAALRASLERAGLWDALQADAAGAQVLDALHASEPPLPGSAWAEHFATATFDAAGFRAWTESVLEAEPFQPVPSEDAAVVITPMARAMLRPFEAVVCPGADAQRLGAAVPPQPLLGDTVARALGVPDARQRQDEERRAFAQLLRLPNVSLSYRRTDGAEPLQPSPLLLQLQWASEQAGRPLMTAVDARSERTEPARPVARPLPVAPHLLPTSLSATLYEALRACPYRFFAQHVLRLDEAEELDDDVDKRDYGIWLHDVLQAFHRARDPAQPAADADLLRQIARDRQAQLLRDEADFLPFAASFDDLLPRYLSWLHEQEAEGVRTEHAELPQQARPAALDPDAPGFRGQLDRIDIVPKRGGAIERILDYKTTSLSNLQARLRDPLEDTQLAFYAALRAAARGDEKGPIEAGYLALDGRQGVKLLLHPDVGDSAAALIDGVNADFARLRAGAAMPALGEGAACDHCIARGLCRRDHWPPGSEPEGPGA